MIVLYGISNCDTVKKAAKWLKEQQVAFQFYDYKKVGLTLDQLDAWQKTMGLDQVLNKKSTTWRQLTDAEQQTAGNKPGALKLMQENTSLIKRPVLEIDGKVVALGFDPQVYAQLLAGT